jgi:phosphoethanolamine N-methyltransferase
MFRRVYLLILTLAVQQLLWAAIVPTDAELHEKINKNYTSTYTLSLEEAYGAGMTSEGGTIAIKKMFKGIPLDGRKMLDIGSGLGGVSLELAEKYHASVIGVEINPWMVEESKKRIPAHLKSKLDYVLMNNGNKLPFANESFDIVYSKGVLTHVPDKTILFKEIFRVLKPQGLFIIDDWLSPVHGQWGAKLNKMSESEGLILFAETEDNYIKLFKRVGFHIIEMRNENKNYSAYNREIIHRLKEENAAKYFKTKYGEKSWQDAIEGYQLIADSIDANELLIRYFITRKSN